MKEALVWLPTIAALLFVEAALGGRLLALSLRAVTAALPGEPSPAPLVLDRYASMLLAFMGFLVSRGCFFTYRFLFRWLRPADFAARFGEIDGPALGERMSWDGLANSIADPSVLLGAIIVTWILMELLRVYPGLDTRRAFYVGVLYHVLLVGAAVAVFVLFKTPEVLSAWMRGMEV